MAAGVVTPNSPLVCPGQSRGSRESGSSRAEAGKIGESRGPRESGSSREEAGRIGESSGLRERGSSRAEDGRSAWGVL